MVRSLYDMTGIRRCFPEVLLGACLAAVVSTALPGASAQTLELPSTAPAPQTTPARDDPSLPANTPIPQPRPAQPDTRVKRPSPAATMPPTEMACRNRLKALGAEFEEYRLLSKTAGCKASFPLMLKRLGKSIDIEPDAIINCAMAEVAARFAADVVSPAAKADFGEDLAMINQASSYACRMRNGTKKLSEHAFANALDIHRFTLSNGTTIDVEPSPPAKHAKLLLAVRKAACGPFKTVLGPGSNADHALHFHFDLAPRRDGATYCR